jgi:hypothetical protein
MKSITLRLFDVDTIIGDSLLAEARRNTLDKIKDRVLQSMGITRKEGEKPIEAWLRAMAEENGLPFSLPVVPELREAVKGSPQAMRFLFWLA